MSELECAVAREFGLSQFRVLVVCRANHCRSPIAQQLLAYEAANRFGSGQWRIDSAGTDIPGAWPLHEHAATVLGERLPSVAPHRSVQLTAPRIADTDLVLTASRAAPQRGGHHTALGGRTDLHAAAVRQALRRGGTVHRGGPGRGGSGTGQQGEAGPIVAAAGARRAGRSRRPDGSRPSPSSGNAPTGCRSRSTRSCGHFERMRADSGRRPPVELPISVPSTHIWGPISASRCFEPGGRCAALSDQPGHPPVGQLLAAGLAGRAVLEGPVGERHLGDDVAAHRARQARSGRAPAGRCASPP